MFVVVSRSASSMLSNLYIEQRTMRTASPAATDYVTVSLPHHTHPAPFKVPVDDLCTRRGSGEGRTTVNRDLSNNVTSKHRGRFNHVKDWWF